MTASTAAIAMLLVVGRMPAAADDKADPPPPVVIRGGTLLTMGPAGKIEGGTLVLRNGKIAAVRPAGRDGRPNARARSIDADGLFVTPGLIDAWTDLGVAPGARSSAGAAAHTALDGLNLYNHHDFQQALRHGVTAVCLEPTAAGGLVGTAALVRLTESENRRESASTDVCLVARLGLGAVGPFARLKQLESLRKAFDGAKKYRETWEDYDEALQKYLKDLKAGKTVKLEKKKPKRPSPPAVDGPPRQRPGRRGRRPRPRPRPPPRGSSVQDVLDWLHELEAFQDDTPGDESGGTPEFCPEDPVPEDPDHDDEPTDLPLDESEALAQDRKPRPAGRKPRSKPKADKKDDKDIKKPKRPAFDADKQVLVRALKRELPVRFEVHRPADILNILDLAAEFNLDATITGASGARHVATGLSAAGVPVILSPSIPRGVFDNGHARDNAPDNAARLARAGVPVAFGGGTRARARTHHLRQVAALAVGHGLDRDAALEAVTIQAARACGAGDRLGSLERQKLADVVIWSGHPLAADSVVRFVFIGGREVYSSED